jgi:hypothetical protein
MTGGQSIAYISDVGAAELKPLFIAGCCVTAVFLDLSFLSDRWLRHRGRLAPNTTIGQKVLSGLTIFFAILGTCGLILLSIFDTLQHHTLHDIFLLLFIAGYCLSAIFICWEYQRLGMCTLLYYPSYNVTLMFMLNDRLPRAPRPAHLVLDQAHLRGCRDPPGRRLRGLHLHQTLQRRRRPRVGHRLHLLLLRFLLLRRPISGRADPQDERLQQAPPRQQPGIEICC